MAVEKQLILRRDPPASLLESNNDLEFELYTALAGSGIPVPPVHWLERDGGALERPFYVMERLPGATDARTLVNSPQFAAIRPQVTRQKAEILAKIHNFDIEGIKSLDRPPSPRSGWSTTYGAQLIFASLPHASCMKLRCSARLDRTALTATTHEVALPT